MAAARFLIQHAKPSQDTLHGHWIGVLAAVLAGCGDVTGSSVPLSRQHASLEPGVYRYALPPDFLVDSVVSIQGAKVPDGCQFLAPADHIPARIPGRAPVRTEISGRVVEVDSRTCLAKVVKSRVVSTDSRRPRLADSALTREETDAPGSTALGRPAASTTTGRASYCPTYGDPGYAWQKTVVEDPAYINVNWDLNEVQWAFNWICVPSATSYHSTGWLTSTGWTQTGRGWNPWDVPPERTYLTATTWSSYYNSTFIACSASSSWAATTHFPNSVRVYADGSVDYPGFFVTIQGSGSHYLLTWTYFRGSIV